MDIVPADFLETYRGLPDEEIAALYADIDSLTTEARSALLAEMQQRRLTEAELQRVHSDELRHEAQFDRLERFRRKRMVLSRLTLDDLKALIVGLVALIIIVWIERLLSHRH